MENDDRHPATNHCGGISMALQFEWDPHKPIATYSIDEERYIGIEFSDRRRLLLVVHTLREPFIRIINDQSNRK